MSVANKKIKTPCVYMVFVVFKPAEGPDGPVWGLKVGPISGASPIRP